MGHSRSQDIAPKSQRNTSMNQSMTPLMPAMISLFRALGYFFSQETSPRIRKAMAASRMTASHGKAEGSILFALRFECFDGGH